MKVVVIEDHDQSVRQILESIQRLDGAVDKVETYPNFQQFVRSLPKRGQPDLLFVDVHDLDAKARRFLKAGKLSSMLFLTNSMKLNGFQLETSKERLGVTQQLLHAEEEPDYEAGGAEPQVEEKTRNAISTAQYGQEWQDRFLVKVNHKMLVISTELISHFFSEGRLVFLKTKDGKKYVIQHTLAHLIQKLLDPRQYFRVNRTYIISLSDIKELQPYPGSRFKVILNQLTEESIIVSRENVNEFRRWLGE